MQGANLLAPATLSDGMGKRRKSETVDYYEDPVGHNSQRMFGKAMRMSNMTPEQLMNFRQTYGKHGTLKYD